MDIPPDLPERPGGDEWRPRFVEAARRRVSGQSWQKIADALEISKRTARDYQNREWWQTAKSYFQEQRRQRHREQEIDEMLAERRQFRAEEKELIHHGTLMSLSALVEIVSGNVHPVTTDDGDVLRDDDGDVVYQEPPSPGNRVAAASSFLKAVGYQEAREVWARMSAEDERRAVASKGDADKGSEALRVEMDLEAMQGEPEDGGEG